MSRDSVKNYRELVEKHVATIKTQNRKVEAAEAARHAAEVKCAEAIHEVERLTVDLEISIANLKTASLELDRRRGLDGELHQAGARLRDQQVEIGSLNAKLEAVGGLYRGAVADTEALQKSYDAQSATVAKANTLIKDHEKAGKRLKAKQEDLDAANLRANQLEAQLVAARATAKQNFRQRGKGNAVQEITEASAEALEDLEAEHTVTGDLGEEKTS